MAGLEGFATGSLETAVAFAAGFALGRALEPVGTKLAQDAYAGHPDKALNADHVATLRAEGLDSAYASAGEAAFSGVSAERLDALVQSILTAPGIADALAMLRRGTITEAQAVHSLRKAKREEQYDAATLELQHERTDPAVIATSIQRGIMHDPGVLPKGPPTEAGRVPPMPVSPLDTLAEAAASGIDEERLAILTRIVGLPASPDLAARMVFRDLIDRIDFDRAIAEGNTRNEWADFLFEGFREILTAHDYAELQLRGWISEAERKAGTAKHGMSDGDSDLLHELIGRPIPVHQVTTGEARGGKYGGTGEGVPEAYKRSLQEGNLRPEWYDLAYANRYSYPSAFVLRALGKDGTLDAAELEKLFVQIGWPPDLAKLVAERTAVTTTTKADPHVAKAQTQFWTTLHKSYVAEEVTDADAVAGLGALGVAEAAHGEVLELWQRERELVRQQLTATQVKKLVTAGTWTTAQALSRLESMGYSAGDATLFLGE